MGIGVEKAKPHQLLQVAGGALFRYGGGHDSSLDQGLAIGDLDARHIVEAKHPAGTQFPHHGWNADAGIVKKLLAEAGRVLGLQPEVELSEQHPPALLGNADPVATAAPAGMALHRRSNLLHHLKVEPEGALQARALHLEHHLTAAAQAGAVHLGQAGRTQRLALQVNYLGAALTQLLLQQVLHHGKGEGGHPVLQGG